MIASSFKLKTQILRFVVNVKDDNDGDDADDYDADDYDADDYDDGDDDDDDDDVVTLRISSQSMSKSPSLILRRMSYTLCRIVMW